MIFQRTWERFVSDWKSFAAMALGLLTVSLVVGLLSFLVTAVAGVGMLYPFFSTDPQVFENPLFLLPIIGQFFSVFAIIGVIMVACAAYVSGGLYGSVVAYRRGEPVGVGLFWREGARHFWRMLGLFILGTAIVAAVQLLGQAIPLIGVFLVLLITPGLNLYFITYPAYLVVADGRGVLQALGQMFVLLGRRPVEAVLATLVYWIFALVLTVGGLIIFIPIIGFLVYFAVAMLAGPFFTYYAYERFETNLRQHM